MVSWLTSAAKAPRDGLGRARVAARTGGDRVHDGQESPLVRTNWECSVRHVEDRG
jgi:hypothetical protein